MHCAYCSDEARGVDEDGEPTCGAESCTPMTGPLPLHTHEPSDTSCAYCSDDAKGCDEDGAPTCGGASCTPVAESE